MRFSPLAFTGWLALSVCLAPAQAGAGTGTVEITVVDKASGKPVPCRMHLKDSAGKPQRAGSLPFWHDHFVFPGIAKLELPSGGFSFEVERGPEYSSQTGSFTTTEDALKKITVELERLADLSAEGWWSGELHVHRPVQDIELLMQAEDLHVAPVITWWNNRNLWADRTPPDELLVQFDTNRFYQIMAGEDEREGGALLYFNLRRPLAITGADREYPSPMRFLAEARRHDNVWIDIEKPFWWDVPIWLASGQVNSIGLANNHMCRSQMSETEAWGKPRNSSRLPPPLGNGYWSQEIYYHILNAGLRIPPSAGSASGVLPNPVGYNRAYVHVEGDFSYTKWWDGLRAGRSFVTNGPLLRVRAAGELPGHVFSASAGEVLHVAMEATLTSREGIRSVEVVKNGQVDQSVSAEHVAKTGKLPSLNFTESGWFLVRVIADNPKTFRFASTAPYYVEIGETKRRISRASTQFFLDWVNERAARVKLDDPERRTDVLRHHVAARLFWEDQVAKSNAK